MASLPAVDGAVLTGTDQDNVWQWRCLPDVLGPLATAVPAAAMPEAGHGTPGDRSAAEGVALPCKVELMPLKIDTGALTCFCDSRVNNAMVKAPWPRFEDFIAARLAEAIPAATAARELSVEAPHPVGAVASPPAAAPGKVRTRAPDPVAAATSTYATAPGKMRARDAAGMTLQRQKLFIKTQPCRFFAQGWCRNGTNCAFAHSAEEMRECPDLTKTSICHLWTRRQCPRSAEECRYAHGTWDIRKRA